VKVFPRDSDSECSASLSVLLTYNILPCTPSPSANRSQLTPPALSPLANELTPRRRCASRRSLRVPPPRSPSQLASAAAAAARSLCPGCPVPDTFCAAAAAATLQLRHPHTTPATATASPYHQLRPVPLRYARFPPPPLCSPPPQSMRVPPPPPVACSPGTPPP
jgi:hypothetical protein